VRPEAVATLVAALRDPRHKVAAAQALLDRGFGRPTVTVHAQHEVNMLHLIAATQLGTDLMEGLGVAPKPEPNTVDHLTALPAPTE
jgi:hypothetical protein